VPVPDLISQTSQQTLNQSTAGNQVPTVVETASSGASLVIWSTDTPVAGTRARVVGADGTPLGAEFTVPTGARGTLLADGDVAAVYFDGGIKVQRYAVDGTAIGAPVTVAAAGTVLDIELLASGGAIVTYASGSSILAQSLDSSLALSGSSFTVGPFVSTPSPTESHLTALAGGGFVHLWDPSGSSSNPTTVPHFRVFDALGNLVSETEFLLGRNDEIDVAALADGGFAVAGKALLSGLERPFIQLFNSDGTTRTEMIAFGEPDRHDGIFLNETTYAIRVVAVSDDLFMTSYYYDALGHGGQFSQLFHVSGREIGPPIAGGRVTDSSGQDDFVVGGNSATDVQFQTWSVIRDNIVIGTAAADSLSGAGGSKALIGFAGDDQYVVDDLDDWVNEVAGEGFDRVSSAVDYALPEGASIEHFTTTFTAGTAPINLYGNELAQSIYGNEGANSLTGGGGADVLLGLGGDDRFYLGPSSSDDVREAVGGGYDRVYVMTTYTLAAGQEIEIIAPNPNAVGQIGITGNEFSQYIYGNATNNRLEGGGGGDVLAGLAGDDMYVIGDVRDSVREAVGEGINDKVYTSISFTLTAGQEIELLATVAQASTAAINLTGNAFDQEIQGNAGNNVLIGGGGYDVLRGYEGDDTYYMYGEADYISSEYPDGGNDKVYVDFDYTLPSHLQIETLAPTDLSGVAAIDLTGNAWGGQLIYGNAGVNTLGGGGGGDLLNGFGGNDSYLIVDARDAVYEGAGGGNDRIYASVDYRLNAGSQVETIGTTNNSGTAAISLTGNEQAQSVYGNAGANVIGGGAGKDSLVGLGGADQYLFDSALNKAFVAAFGLTAATDNVDLIYDFAADDRILLESDVFGLPTGALAASAFNLGTVATEADDRVLYDAASRALLFDADGTGSAAAQLIAFLNAPFAMDAAHVVVV
jgi:Ca2+-binding RTX toxin-like protein